MVWSGYVDNRTVEERYRDSLKEEQITQESLCEWSVSVPVGDYNTSIPFCVRKEGVVVDYVTIPWSEIDKARDDLKENPTQR